MLLRASELRCKDVVSLKNGCRIGSVCDFQIDTATSRINTLIVYGSFRFFGLLGRRKDIIINWCDIALIGEDAILVNCDFPSKRKRKKR